MKDFIICMFMKCQICNSQLNGRQQKWCSLKCKRQSDNFKHKNYQCQQSRGRQRKIEFVKRMGGCCQICGYDKNYAALNFHHMDPKQKLCGLNLRVMSNNSMEFIEAELQKCKLLCRNCHDELHNPQMDRAVLELSESIPS